MIFSTRGPLHATFLLDLFFLAAAVKTSNPGVRKSETTT
jgi:hypothetical protein